MKMARLTTILIMTITVSGCGGPSRNLSPSSLPISGTPGIDFVPNEFLARFKLDLVVNITQNDGGIYLTGFPDVDSLNVRYGCISIDEQFKVTRGNRRKWTYLGNNFKFKFRKIDDLGLVIQDYVNTGKFMHVYPNGIMHTFETRSSNK